MPIRWIDNVFVERLWRSLKYEEVYLKAYETPRQAEQKIGQYFRFYNKRRRHQALNYLTPNEVYFNLPNHWRLNEGSVIT